MQHADLGPFKKLTRKEQINFIVSFSSFLRSLLTSLKKKPKNKNKIK